jgi:hypothetical protein
MPESADVRSIDALREWHAALATYGDGLAEALAGVNLEIRRAYDWLGEQMAQWQRAVRDCQDEVTRAKAELSQRKFPGWDGREPDCTVQEKALRLARARLEHAEDQVVKCRQWIGRLPKAIDEVYLGASRRLSNFLEAELPKGLADLARRVGALESYAGLRPDYAPAPAGSSAPPGPSGTQPPTPAPQGGADQSPDASGLGGEGKASEGPTNEG